MMSQDAPEKSLKLALLEMTADIVAAYMRKNAVSKEELIALIRVVHETLGGAKGGTTEAAKPAVSPARSITPNHLICLEDGRKLKMLKRYLRSVYNMSPEDYRRKWGLPLDYPMVAPNYAKQRSAFAKKIGLGRTPRRGAVRAS